MSDYSYPSRHDMTQTLSKDFVSAKFVKSFAQKKGIFIFRAGQEGSTNFLSSLFFENKELEEIRNKAFNNSPERTLSSFKYVEEKKDSPTPLDAIDQYIQDLTKQGSNPDNIKITNPKALMGEKDTFQIQVTYTKNKKGRISILQKEKHDFDAYIKKESSTTYSIVTDSTSSSDQKFMLDILKKHLSSNGKFNKLELDVLLPSETITFFDNLSTNAMGIDWAFEEVTKLVLKKPQEIDSEEESSQTALQGITQAILEGQDLRQNKFVLDSEENGYRFTAMTYKYAHKKEPYIIEISAQFKGRPKVFEVAIKKYKIKEVEADLSSKSEDVDYPQTQMDVKKSILAAAEKIYRTILQERE